MLKTNRDIQPTTVYAVHQRRQLKISSEFRGRLYEMSLVARATKQSRQKSGQHLQAELSTMTPATVVRQNPPSDESVKHLFGRFKTEQVRAQDRGEERFKWHSHTPLHLRKKYEGPIHTEPDGLFIFSLFRQAIEHPLPPQEEADEKGIQFIIDNAR